MISPTWSEELPVPAGCVYSALAAKAFVLGARRKPGGLCLAAALLGLLRLLEDEAMSLVHDFRQRRD